MAPKHLLGIALGLGAALIPLAATAEAQDPSAQPPAAQAPKTHAETHKARPFHSEGERVFAQNCSRCHNAPEGFSPRISGTIARHMRVRAQLSQHDEQELLRFLNP
jgi:cytochrome c5